VVIKERLMETISSVKCMDSNKWVVADIYHAAILPIFQSIFSQLFYPFCSLFVEHDLWPIN
jgi:hypothetical protein